MHNPSLSRAVCHADPQPLSIARKCILPVQSDVLLCQRADGQVLLPAPCLPEPPKTAASSRSLAHRSPTLPEVRYPDRGAATWISGSGRGRNAYPYPQARLAQQIVCASITKDSVGQMALSQMLWTASGEKRSTGGSCAGPAWGNLKDGLSGGRGKRYCCQRGRHRRGTLTMSGICVHPWQQVTRPGGQCKRRSPQRPLSPLFPPCLTGVRASGLCDMPAGHNAFALLAVATGRTRGSICSRSFLAQRERSGVVLSVPPCCSYNASGPLQTSLGARARSAITSAECFVRRLTGGLRHLSSLIVEQWSLNSCSLQESGLYSHQWVSSAGQRPDY